jgi:hypothetical protein
MLRVASIALFAFAAAASAVAQDLRLDDLGNTDLGGDDSFTAGTDTGGIDFILRPSQEPADEIDEFYGNPSAPPPSGLDLAIGPPLAGPAGPLPAVDGPVGLPLAGPVGPVAQPAPPRRLRDENPFAAIGIKLGSFILRPSLEVGIGATDNVAGGRDEEAAIGLALATALNIRSENDRHLLEADLNASGILYGDEEFDEREGEARVRGRYDLTSHTSVEGEAGYRFSLDRYTDPDTPDAATERPAVHNTDVTLGATQRFGNFSLGAGTRVERTTYDEVAVAGGGTANREELNNTEYGVFVRPSYQASAAATPFAQIGFGRREYDVAVDDDGFERSSLWGELRGGLIFDFGSKLAGEVSVGGRRETLDDEDLEDLSAFLADASITWSPRRLTEIRFEASTDLRATGLAGASGSVVYSGGLTASQQISARLRLEAGAGLGFENFVGIEREDVTLSAFAGASYAFNRRASAVARYSYERTDSTDPEDDTDENVVSVRLRFQR